MDGGISSRLGTPARDLIINYGDGRTQTILDRIIVQTLKYCNDINIISNEINTVYEKNYNINYIKPKNILSNSIAYAIKSKGEDHNIILLSDTIYSDELIKLIFDSDKKFKMFGRKKPSIHKIKRCSERYAMITPIDNEFLYGVCEYIKFNYDIEAIRRARNFKGGLYDIYTHTTGSELLYKEVNHIDITDDMDYIAEWENYNNNIIRKRLICYPT